MPGRTSKVVNVILFDGGFEGPAAGQVDDVKRAGEDRVDQIEPIAGAERHSGRDGKDEQDVIVGPGLAKPCARNLENRRNHREISTAAAERPRICGGEWGGASGTHRLSALSIEDSIAGSPEVPMLGRLAKALAEGLIGSQRRQRFAGSNSSIGLPSGSST